MEQNFSIFSFRVLRTPLIIVGFFVAIEILYRLFTFGGYATLNWVKYNPQGILLADINMPVENPNISWKLKPNVDTIYKMKPFTTNSFGFRNPEITLAKDPDKTRIVVLGRSITMGAGVPDDEIYSRVLEDLLNKMEPNSFEVINCAVAGYSLKQIFTFYEEYVSELKPDMIIILLSKKDISIKEPAPIPSLLDVQPGWSSLNYRLSYTFTYESFKHVVKGATNRFLTMDWDKRVALINHTAVDTTTRQIFLTQFIKDRHQDQVHTYLVMPNRRGAQLSGGPKELQEWIKDLEGVTYLDINDYMEPRMPKKAYIYFSDTHPNSKVHRLYAEAIFNHFKSGAVKR